MPADIPYSEALALLAAATVCDDCGEWVFLKAPKGSARIRRGVTDQHGVNVGLYVELLYMMGPQTHIPKFKLTLFRSTTHGPERIYQLHIEKFKKAPKHLHAMAHEHIGDSRVTGAADWLSWTWETMINRFSTKCGVKFIPDTPPDPEIFDLKGQTT